MNTDQGWRLRLAILSTLVKRAPAKPGRTALMKFAYLLQTIRRVPLEYRFKLYNYGPYDPDVLSDVARAVSFDAIKSEIVYYASGYGYEYSSNDLGHEALCRDAKGELERISGDIDWVLHEFGTCSASQLELISTVIYAAREMQQKHHEVRKDELCQCVNSIKPYFSQQTIGEVVDNLAGKSLIALTSA